MEWVYALMIQAYGVAGNRPVLSVKPSTGVVAANSRLGLTATFAPAAEAPLAGRITCAVRRMSRPLALTAKGSGYLLRDSMQVHSTLFRQHAFDLQPSARTSCLFPG